MNKSKIKSVKFNWFQWKDGDEAGDEYEFRTTDINLFSKKYLVDKIELREDGGVDIYKNGELVETAYNINNIKYYTKEEIKNEEI